MDFIEHLRVREKRAETGLGTEIDRPAAVFHAWKIGRIGIPKDPPTERDKARMLLARGR
jgi:hypothetical protein